MSWWQGKFLNYSLRHILSRSGFLDEKAIESHDFDIKLGRNNVIELKNVGLNIQKLSQLIQLPPCLRIQTARVLLLRLTIPTDFWQSSIQVEVDGIHLSVEYDELSSRLQSPNLHRGFIRISDNPQASIVHEITQSFIQHEPEQTIRDVKTSVSIVESPFNDDDDDDDDDADTAGTGVGVGMPSFLDSFARGIASRIQLQLKNIVASLELCIPTHGQAPESITLQLRIGEINVGRVCTASMTADDTLLEDQNQQEQTLLHPSPLRTSRVVSPLRWSVQSSHRSSSASSYHMGNSQKLRSPSPVRFSTPEEGLYQAVNRRSQSRRNGSEDSESELPFAVAGTKEGSGGQVVADADASMYMSAITTASTLHVPGSWDLQDSTHVDPNPPYRPPSLGQPCLQRADSPGPKSDVATPRAQSPRSNELPSREPHAKLLLAVDQIMIYIPQFDKESEESEESTVQDQHSQRPERIPGSFSVYSERGTYSQVSEPLSQEDSGSTMWSLKPVSRRRQTRIVVDSVKGTVDLKSANLLLKAAALVTANIPAQEMQSETSVESDTSALSLALSIQRHRGKQRPLLDISTEMLPVKIGINVAAVEAVLGKIGNFIDDMQKPGPHVDPRRGVRFEETKPKALASTELKITGVIYGVKTTLQGQASAVGLRTSKIKFLHREYGSAATVSKIEITGPKESSESLSMRMELESLRVDYLTVPEDKDLERLISLITPSNDKYDNDDDIMVDTLLRQRRQGGLARVAIGNVKVNVVELACAEALKQLGDEVGTLSTLAKFIPNDDRPGPLTLARVRNFAAHCPVNERFGKLQVVIQDFHCAHVAMPSLLAFSIREVSAHRSGYGVLVRPLLTSDDAFRPPMVMMRTLGDEVEPVNKLKLFNLCLEYSVPTLVALVDRDLEEVAVDLAESIISHAAEDIQEVKPIKINLLLHDSGVRLASEDMSASAVVVFNDANLLAQSPFDNGIIVSLLLRRSGMYLTDGTKVPQTKPRRLSFDAMLPDAHVTNALGEEGYVSIGSIRQLEATLGLDKKQKTTEVDVKSDLILLETCADSTQTLLELVGGLAPPSPPSKQQQYLTEPMTIQDMMSSFTGEPEEKAEERVESKGSGMLFDAEEDDPFEMPEMSVDDGLDDRSLMQELMKQCDASANVGGAVDIELYEVDDLGLGYRLDQSRQGKLQTERPQKAPVQARVRDVNFVWHLHDGYDWPGTREKMTQAIEELEMRLEQRRARVDHEEEEPVIEDELLNSVYIGIPAHSDVQETRRQINHGIDEMATETESIPYSAPSRQSVSERQKKRRLELSRSRMHKASFDIQGLSADLELFPDAEDIVNTIDVRVNMFEIYDNVPTSTWRKFVTILHVGSRERELAKPMIHLEMQTVKTLRNFSASELLLNISVLPLRLHVDQDALDFIVRFFDFKPSNATVKPPANEPFIQRLEVSDVDLLLDYKPKRVDYASLHSGHTSEFMNFATLVDAPIKLRHTIVYGLRGFTPIHKTLNDIWLPDVTRHQLPPILGGISPFRHLTNVGTAFKNVITIPIKEYRKDGRLVRSIQKGTVQFSRTASSELARFGATVAIGTQNLLQNTETLLSSAAARRSSRDCTSERRLVSRYANQPAGLLPGIRDAMRQLERDLLTARDAFVAVQGDIADDQPVTTTVARHAPILLLRPVIGATGAVGKTLLGVGNQIDREGLKRNDEVRLSFYPLGWGCANRNRNIKFKIERRHFGQFGWEYVCYRGALV
ncbi:hypothetical protein K470DRAFT_229359 [Piedraia hortae CBS 480.64]|uniref:Autophagy-related protein 2 n=1 Tax=Piedraia hortae CBS 480.64 TaxID=1314780 RepID=A0A6A7C4F6_9PEZI|nr:hypothetical protein K470DRAFT_229359 [Piedraia hortae CBS 480.64]